MRDSHTYGNSLASAHLSDVLSLAKNKKYSRKVGRIFTQYCKLFNDIRDIKDKKSYRAVRHLVIEKAKKSLVDIDVPPLIKQLTLNVFAARYRQLMAEYNG